MSRKNIERPMYWFGLLLLANLTAACAAYSEPLAADPSAKPIRDHKVSDLFIPQDMGAISEIHAEPAPNASQRQRVLFLIQDAHVNYEGQKNLAKILDKLAQDYGIRLILVEGGEGNMSLSYLREWSDPEELKTIAAAYLESGAISGEEYLDLTSERDLLLWGIEDKKLYDQNFEIFLEVERVRSEIQPDLQQMQAALAQLLPKVMSPAYLSLEKARNDFDAGSLSLKEYTALLVKEADRLGIDHSAYPEFNRYAALTKSEAGLDLKVIADEQRRLAEVLNGKATAAEVSALAEISKKLQASQTDKLAFYSELERLAKSYAVNLADYPAFTSYLAYLKEVRSIKVKQLWAHLEALAEALQKALAKTPEQARLMQIAKGMEQFDRLMRLKWMPADYRLYKESADAWQPSRWVEDVKADLAQAGLDVPLPLHPERLDAALARTVRFYEAAYARDAAMAERTVRVMADEQESMAALVVGGFHSESLGKRFVEQGIKVVVITPRVSPEQDSARYSEILKLSNGVAIKEPVQ